jgi:hypothetical protein
MKPRQFILLAAAFTLAACSTTKPSNEVAVKQQTPQLEEIASPAEAGHAKIAAAYVLQRPEGSKPHSVATLMTWTGVTQLYVSAFGKDQIEHFEAPSGKYIDSYGKTGSKLGELAGPGALAVFGESMFVAEETNHRISVFQMPEMRPMIFYGTKELTRPIAIATIFDKSNVLNTYILDATATGLEMKHFGLITTVASFEQREQTTVTASFKGAHKISNIVLNPSERASLSIDAENGQFIVALQGKFIAIDRNWQVATFAPLAAAPSSATSAVLWSCDGKATKGYWVVGTQGTDNNTQIWDRTTGTLVGDFTNERGLGASALFWQPTSIGFFPNGVLFATNSEANTVSAFGWDVIAKPLGLRKFCL